MSEQSNANNSLQGLLSRISPQDMKIIGKYISDPNGRKRLFTELCKEDLGFWTMLMREVDTQPKINFDDAMYGAMLAFGAISRRSKIDYLRETYGSVEQKTASESSAVEKLA